MAKAKIEMHFDCSPELFSNSEELQELALQILTAEKAPAKILSLIFTGDELVRQLNTDFRKKAKTTDVLSFPMEDEEYLGEVYISVEQVIRQAPRFDNTTENELCRMVTHGILHVLGYDHIKPSDRKVMRAKEELYLNRTIY